MNLTLFSITSHDIFSSFRFCLIDAPFHHFFYIYLIYTNCPVVFYLRNVVKGLRFIVGSSNFVRCGFESLIILGIGSLIWAGSYYVTKLILAPLILMILMMWSSRLVLNKSIILSFTNLLGPTWKRLQFHTEKNWWPLMRRDNWAPFNLRNTPGQTIWKREKRLDKRV